MDGCTQRGLRGLLEYELPLYVERCRDMGVSPDVITSENYKWLAEIKAEYCPTCVDRDSCGVI